MGPLIPGPDAPAFGFGLRPPRGPAGRALHRAATALTELAGTPLRRRLDEIRADFGLGPLGESVNRHTARLPLYLVGNVRELDYGRHDLPRASTTSATASGTRSARSPTARPPRSGWRGSRPSDRGSTSRESTLAYGDPFLLRTAVEALADQPVELIVAVGSQRDPAAPGFDVSAPNVHVTRWVDHGELLPRCAALITVGGKATVMAAAEAGVPMVVVPTTWDKPDNARRVTEAGIGVRVSPRSAARSVCGRPSVKSSTSRGFVRRRGAWPIDSGRRRVPTGPPHCLEELAVTTAPVLITSPSRRG